MDPHVGHVCIHEKLNKHVNGSAISVVTGGRFRAFLGYFPVTSHLFPKYFLNISHFLTISQLFFTYFSKISHFQTISGLFLTSQLLLSYFSTISHLLLSHFSTIS